MLGLHSQWKARNSAEEASAKRPAQRLCPKRAASRMYAHLRDGTTRSTEFRSQSHMRSHEVLISI
jgi:hypothetical protein